MSTPTARPPRTSARALAVATALAVLVLTAYDQWVAVGVIAGGALAAAVAVSTGRSRRALAAALLPIGVVGAVGGVAFASRLGVTTVVLTGIAVPLGMALSVVVLGGGSAAQLRQTGALSVYAAAVAACATGLAVFAAAVGGPAATVELLLWATGESAFGLGLAVVVAGLAVAGGIVTIPPAAITTRQSEEEAILARRTAAVIAVLASLVVVAGLAILLVIARFPVVPGALGDWLAGSWAVRGVLLVIAALGVGLAFVSLVARSSWSRPPDPPDPVVSTVCGTGCGFLVVGAAIVLVGPPTIGEWTVLLAVATLVFVGIGFILPIYAELLENGAGPPARTVVALALCASGVIAGTSAAHGSGPATGTSLAGVSALVAIAAGVFVFRAGRFGQRLGAEVGRAGATRRPQLVRLGWFGVVTALGLVVAVGGLWIATVFAPTLSVPAAAGLLAGTVGLFAGLWLLLQ
jgi:hypothetical protein